MCPWSSPDSVWGLWGESGEWEEGCADRFIGSESGGFMDIQKSGVLEVAARVTLDEGPTG
ncbi:hypothetical protein [Acidithiobacillus thiooxidans]|uniref:hypothetical protein n=1 Tax=Acidithiobacillus thiooxidans TaxID=930 RepID=UPI00356AC557